MVHRIQPTGVLLLIFWLGFAPGAGGAAQGQLWTEGSPAAGQESHLLALSKSLSQLAKRLRPAVVQIGIKSEEERPPEHPPVPEERPRVGSGFIISRDGYIVTNNHVVSQATEIEVELFGKERLPAKVIGRDARTDLALLKVESSTPLAVLPLGDSDALEIGELVLTIGHPFGLDYAVSLGIVSRKGPGFGLTTPFDEFIQTDAAINPGNSGGPLLNLRGEVIGINTAVIPNRQVGFAIPINLAKVILPQLLEKGKVAWGFLGVTIQNLDGALAQALGYQRAKGALVSSVMPGRPAEVAGVRRGDIIVTFDGKEVEDVRDLQRRVAMTPVGTAVPVTVFREGKPLELLVRVGEFPETFSLAAVEPPKKDLGLTVEVLDAEKAKQFKIEEEQGLVVTEVVKDGPAAKSGIRPGDLVREVNRREVNTLEAYQQALQHSLNGVDLFLVQRGEGFFYIAVKPKG